MKKVMITTGLILVGLMGISQSITYDDFEIKQTLYTVGELRTNAMNSKLIGGVIGVSLTTLPLLLIKDVSTEPVVFRTVTTLGLITLFTSQIVSIKFNIDANNKLKDIFNK